MYDTLLQDTIAVLPIVIVGVTSLIMVVVDSFWNDSKAIPVLAGVGLVGALLWECFHFDQTGQAFFGQLIHGGFASYINIVILLTAFFSFVLTAPYLERIRHHFGEVYSLLMLATAGMMTMANANSLLTVFVGLETMSISLYVLTGLVREDIGSIEAAMKYFLLGAFATGFFVYGVALIYGATHTLSFGLMAEGLHQYRLLLLFWAGVGLILVGFLFKVSAAPFHMWAPDAYQGAPTTISGFMATGSKAAAFAALILLLWRALAFETLPWSEVLALVAALTMIVGNFLALVQRNAKRLLAYSSIAHAGYVLVGLAAGNPDGYSGALYYLLAYSLMTLGAFGVLAYLEWDGKVGREQTLDSLKGIGMRYPLLGVAMAFFMFSLLGFPPLAGFFAKYRVFLAAIRADMVWLAILGVLTSIVSAGYYLKILWLMWMVPPEEALEKQEVQLPLGVRTALVVLALGLLVIGIWAPRVFDVTDGFFQISQAAFLM